jgi:predicted ATPase
MKKIPISGGPHSGKTTLLEALYSEFDDAYFVAEPAEQVITRELAKQSEDAAYTPNVPWIDYSKFGPEVADESVRLEADIPDDANLVFQDRSLIDTIAYCRLNGFERFIPEVERRIKIAKYSFALFCEPVGTYTATEVRRETVEEARKTHDFLAEAYDQSGISVIHLLAVPVPERLSLVKAAIADVG